MRLPEHALRNSFLIVGVSAVALMLFSLPYAKFLSFAG
jgi:hypothetical protein